MKEHRRNHIRSGPTRALRERESKAMLSADLMMQGPAAVRPTKGPMSDSTPQSSGALCVNKEHRAFQTLPESILVV